MLAGGIGSERKISLQSGENVAAAMKESGLDVITSDITPDDMSILDEVGIDVFFPVLHGQFGEDGGLQMAMEQRDLVYTGSGPMASRLAFDKCVAKNFFRQCAAFVPREIKVDIETDIHRLIENFADSVEDFAVKPTSQGSSVGVEIVHGRGVAIEAAQKCVSRFGDCMIEEFICGREITVGILNGRALPIIEIQSQSQFYDYNAKYDNDTTRYLFDTIADEQLSDHIKRTAVECFEVLGCRHLGRVDMILSDHNVPYVLEINTLPGFTAHSLLPMAAAKEGLGTGELCIKIIEGALETFGIEAQNT